MRIETNKRALGYWLFAAVLIAFGTLPAAAAEPQEAEVNAREAVDRVVASHDKTLLLGGGQLMIKQSAIRSARKLLGEWGREAGLGGEWWDSAPQYRAAKAELLKSADAIIERR